MLKPPIIRYNLKERGRQFRGVERNFDIPAIVAAINSPSCQERVKTRGMLGYFGHWARIKFGLDPAEGGIVDGKAQAIEAAIVTTYLKAFPDGTIEHQTEFMDNPVGHIVSRMFENRVGGFSSVIDPNIPEFFGFDWVNDPNYSTNRGYDLILDSASPNLMSPDELMMAEYAQQLAMVTSLLKSSEYREKLALDSANRLKNENDELLDLMASGKTGRSGNGIYQGKNKATSRFEADKSFFDSALSLPIQKEESAPAESKNDIVEYNNLKGRMGY